MSDLPRPSAAPCGSCPYRVDVPSGIWAREEYEKLTLYDGETWEQSPALFYCHQNDGHLCAGWAGCHDTDELLALRLNRVSHETFEYVSPVPLFGSGAEAASHGMAAIDCPDRHAVKMIDKLAARRLGIDR
ncbi:MAG: hypothetical protein Tp170SUR191951_84 [Prokaryotic dsDNA virus sp.]|nr:MAG: hypothetical protein Tp170SUR191951_84 [Prokaryotic dsDNA virus sp.]